MPAAFRTGQTDCGSPTETKNAPDFVPMVTEPRNLIQDRVDKPDHVRSQIHIVPPSLTLSNSSLTIPLSLESSSNLIHCVSTLAMRRGKKTPASLRCKHNASKIIDYPSIPTAFLGSPSTYAPRFEHANGQDDVSLGVEEMINNLRLQCAAMVPHTPSWSVIFDNDDITAGDASLPLLTATSSPLEGDGSIDDHEQKSMQVNTILPQSIHSKCEVVQSTPKSKLAAVASMDPKMGFGNNRGNLRQKPHTGVSGSAKHPLTTPLPLRPALACYAVSQEGARRYRKTVRFATLPAQRSQVSGSFSTPRLSRGQLIVDGHTPTPHQQHFHSKNSPGHRRSLSRQIFIMTPEKSNWGRTPIAHTPAHLRPRATGVLNSQSLNTSSKPNLPQLKRRSLGTPGTTPLRDSTALRNKQAGDEAPNQANVPLFRRSAASLGRQSLSYIMKGGKENYKQKPSLSTSFSYGCQKVDDRSTPFTNSTRGSRTLKSRMPLPLRNILTRFTSEREYSIIATATQT